MKCTKCNGETKLEKFKGIEIDRCTNCKSIWLDYSEMDQLEDTIWKHDELKGSLFYGTKESDIKCPKCGINLKKINYRFYDLELEYCPNECGFYLDNGEEKRVLELIKNEKKSTKRKFAAENDWSKLMSHIKSKSFLDKLKLAFKK
jgi:hypothetical protein